MVKNSGIKKGEYGWGVVNWGLCVRNLALISWGILESHIEKEKYLLDLSFFVVVLLL